MKKYIFTIAALSSLFAFPVFAQSTSQTNISEKTIDATADMLAENVCHSYSSFIPKQIYECYERKDEKSSNFEKCILADTYVMFGLTHMREKLSELGRPDVTKRAPFLQEYKYENRFEKNMKLPQFSHLKPIEQQRAYFKNAIQKVENKINAKCKTMNTGF